jgi:excisionase family DNA binding protein
MTPETIVIEPVLALDGRGRTLPKLAQSHKSPEVATPDPRLTPEARPMSLHSVDDAARLLSICKSTLYGLMRNGEIRSARIGRRRLVSDKAISDFIDANEKELGQEVL